MEKKDGEYLTSHAHLLGLEKSKWAVVLNIWFEHASSHIWQDGNHGKGRLGVDGSFGVEESTCLWPLYGLVLLGVLCLSI
jgi:hypothetical protein